jgi:alpha-beta hydrolase superfamily lysophospholipase
MDRFKGWENYNIIEKKFVSFDNTQINYKIFHPLKFNKKKVKKILFIVHGWNEHSGCYHHIASYFISVNYLVFVMDLRGHGRSGGLRGHVDSWSDYIKDCNLLLEKITIEYAQIPIDILAHSMGGLVAIRLIQTIGPSRIQEHIRKLVLSGPLLKLVLPVPKIKITFGQILSNIIPKYSFIERMDSHILTHDSIRAESYSEDILRHYTVTAKWFVEMQEAIKKVEQEAAFVTIPILVVHGGLDQVNALEGSQYFYDLIRSERKAMKVFPEMYHEVLNETDNLKVFRYISAWLGN